MKSVKTQRRARMAAFSIAVVLRLATPASAAETPAAPTPPAVAPAAEPTSTLSKEQRSDCSASICTALPGVLGALAGGTMTVLAAFLALRSGRKLEAKRWEREDRRRFDLDRRALYSKFLAEAVALATDAAERISLEEKQAGGRQGAELLACVERLIAKLEVQARLFEEVSLIGSPPVRDALSKFGATFEKVLDSARRADRASFEKHFKVAETDLEDFRREARKELGIPES